MSLVIEDGSTVPNANSYVSRAEYIAHAAALGTVVPDETSADTELLIAVDYMETFRSAYKGYLMARDQPLSFPRGDFWLDGWDYTHTEIPALVKQVQMALALEVHANVDLYNPPVNPSRAVKRQRVEGAVEVEYFGGGKPGSDLRVSGAQKLLSRLLGSRFGVPLMRG